MKAYRMQHKKKRIRLQEASWPTQGEEEWRIKGEKRKIQGGKDGRIGHHTKEIKLNS